MPHVSARQSTGLHILDAAEELFAKRGYSAVSLREIARHAGVVVSNVTYHHGDKFGILSAISDRHTRPMNARRLELLGEARRIPDRSERLRAIIRAYLLPAFLAWPEDNTGGLRFTRIQALVSAEGDAEAQRLLAVTIDDTAKEFIDAFSDCLPNATRQDIVWRSHFLLGAMFFTMINPDRIARLSDADEMHEAVNEVLSQLVAAGFDSLFALSPESVRILA